MWLALLSWSHAVVPLPPHPGCAPDHPELCPPDLDDWELLSFIPAGSLSTIRPAEVALGSGIGLDVAVRYTAGRWDVPVAVLDSGIDWGATRLVEKVLLNDGELPLPHNADGVEVADLDGNGLLNTLDYAEDARVSRDAGFDGADDRLDPSDLIAAFSNGFDEDGNGYVDDIAGWDFFGDDNDPYSILETGFATHGTGIMTESTEPGGDGSGIGTCPNCPVLPVRIGDTFIVDGDRVAQGIAYATDRGARVMAMAIGSLTHPEHARRAIRYAIEHDVVLVSAAGDENAYHHNVPAVEDGILYVHSVQSDARDGADGAYSFFNTWNCNNYGPRLDLVGASTSCASGSTAAIAGAAGLIVSAGLDHGVALSGDEVRALLTTTADDVALTDEERSISRAYPSKEGWDAFYGYGRADVGNAVTAVFEDRIPPEARIDGPRWYAWPPGDVVSVTGHVAAPRSTSVSWRIDVGCGAEPEDWFVGAEGTGAVDGVLADVAIDVCPPVVYDDLDEQTVVERMHRAHAPLVTLRLIALDAELRSTEARRGVWRHPDPDRFEGFPLDLGSSIEASPVLADLDGDDVFEIVVVDSGGRVHAFDAAGAELAGFPLETPVMASLRPEAPAVVDGALAGAREGVSATPAVGDLDGDGLPEVVVATIQGTVLAWHHDGAPVDGFPVRITPRRPDEYVPGAAFDRGVGSAPTLADVDDDGTLDVVLGGMDQRLYAWDHTGALRDGYPVDLCKDRCGFRILSSPAVGDLDADGDLDAVLGTNEVPVGAAGVAWALDLRTGAVLDGWPVERDGLLNQTVLPVLGEGHPAPVALADFDDDGFLEVVSNAMLGSTEILDHTGRVVRSLPGVADRFGEDSNVRDGAVTGFATHPALGELDGDGVPDVVMGGGTPQYLVSLAAVRMVEFDHAVGAWSGAAGTFLPGFPRQLDDVAFLHAAGVADVDGDGRAEVIHGSGGYLVYAWAADGTLAEGWPKHSGGWVIGSPAIGDVDGDGFVDVVVSTRSGELFVWSTRGRADQAVQWAANHHDAANTSNWHTPLPTQAGPPDDDVEEPGGCGCDTGGAGASPLALGLALLWRRRRRR